MSQEIRCEFIEEIRNYIDDDAPRLVYADWLEEQGDPLGEFIRTQIELTNLAPKSERALILRINEKELLRKHRTRWIAPLGRRSCRHVFRRGFVDECAMPADWFIRKSGSFLPDIPLRHVELENARGRIGKLIECPGLIKIRGLTLPPRSFESDSMTRFADSPNITNLESLRIDRNKIGDPGIEAIADSPYLTRLRELSVSECQITDAGCESFARIECETLRRLDMSVNMVTSLGVEMIANGGFRLESLNLYRGKNRNGPAMGDGGLTAIATGPATRQLRHLMAPDHEIRRGGVIALAHSPLIESLEFLDLYGNPIARDARDRLEIAIKSHGKYGLRTIFF